jgi:hypothetical protein
MDRTVIGIYSDIKESDTKEEEVRFNLYLAPGDIDQAKKLYIFDCTPEDQAFIKTGSDSVKCAGMRLFETLARHPAVSAAITGALAIPQEGIAPLYIHLNADRVEGLPWESLYVPPGMFLALDARWPIARIADSSTAIEIERTFKPPLKVMAVLSAADVDATPEWKELYKAIQGTQEIELQIFTCQPELKEQIEGLHDQRVTVNYIVTKSDLFAALNTFDPHILHFFCHGSTNNGAHLQLATRADWDGEKESGSIAIGKDELAPFCKKERNIWLVTLNCCQGAAAAEDTYSLARSLVTKGFPAVIGMREVIATQDAHLFCRAFYSAVLQEIELCKKTGQDIIEVEWAKALHLPRTELCDQHNSSLPRPQAAATFREWTLPVIYVRPERFKLRIGTKHLRQSKLSLHEREVLEAQLKGIREFKATVPDIPQSVMDDIEKRIHELEKKLY